MGLLSVVWVSKIKKPIQNIQEHKVKDTVNINFTVKLDCENKQKRTEMPKTCHGKLPTCYALSISFSGSYV